ncbi:MAG: tyrosine-type recombinase/integrase [Planctomycetota bacterium]|nr:tyrosine-type recombinase/integrase [Planctomycetota bacterium]
MRMKTERKKAGRRSFGSVIPSRGREGFRLAWSWQGHRHWRYAGLTRKEAERKARSLQVDLDRGVPHDEAVAKVWGDTPKGELTFREAAKHYLAGAESRLRPRTIYNLSHRLRLILQAAWGDAPLASITVPDIERWRDGRKREGIAVSTCNRDLDAIRGVLSWAEARGYVPSNPARKVKAFSEKGRERRMYLTIEEAALFLQAAQDEGDALVQRFLIVALRTGARRGELLSLEWRDVPINRAEMTIRAEVSKSRKTRIVPLGKTAIETFRQLRGGEKIIKADGTDPVFSENGKPLTVCRLRYHFRKIRTRMAKVDGFPAEKLSELVIHSLRHTFCSLALQAGVNLWTVQKWAGHSSAAITSTIYGHFDSQASRPSMNILDRALDCGDTEKKGSAEGGA